MRSKKKKKRLGKKRISTISIILLIVIIAVLLFLYKMKENRNIEFKHNIIVEKIKSHYNEYVITNKDALIYKNDNGKYLEVGKIGNAQELVLGDTLIDYKTEYFKVISFGDEFYIKYNDVDVIENLKESDYRYKKYIIFNKNVISKDKTNFYNKEGDLVYSLPIEIDLPIIINSSEMYGVEYNSRLLYLKKSDGLEVRDNVNTDIVNTSGIAVLNYHFFYDESIASERKDCNQMICHNKTGFTKHLDYIKDNGIFTPTMDEFEMYLDKEIQLPKSVMITIDDGWRTEIAKELLEEYELNATIFLITSWFEEINFLDFHEYIEYHSHGDDLHNQGVCPGGQGGAIKCQNRGELLDDLALSRKKLGGTTSFCYPFYEYNSYSISVLKEAGFTIAFGGGGVRAMPGVDKYRVPRYVMYDSTTVNQLKNYIG